MGSPLITLSLSKGSQSAFCRKIIRGSFALCVLHAKVFLWWFQGRYCVDCFADELNKVLCPSTQFSEMSVVTQKLTKHPLPPR